MISNRKAKRLQARGKRIYNVATKHIQTYQATREITKINNTSAALAELYWQWEFEEVDANLYSYAIG